METQEIPTERTGDKPAPPHGQVWAAVVLIICIVGGTITGLALMPAAFRAIPNDRARTRVILRALHSAATPQIAIFGDSVAMSGIDARALSAAMPSHPLAWNLASPAQTTAESFLYYQELPQSVRTIVQVFSTHTLANSRPFDREAFNAFYLNGYRPAKRTLASLTSTYGQRVRRIMQAPAYRQRATGRWVVQQGLDTAIRRVLRSDLQIERGVNDLFFPAVFTTRLTPSALKADLAPFKTPLPDSGVHLSTENELLLRAMADSATAAGRRFVLVFPPVRPALQRYFGPAFLRDLASFGADHPSTALVIDASQTVQDESSFADSRHLLQPAARRFTAFLATKLDEGT